MTAREDTLVVGTWWRGRDRLPKIPRSAMVSIVRCSDDSEMALASGSMEGAVAARRAAGNVPYIARLRGEAVGYVWVARSVAHIPPLGLSFDLPDSDRMICDLHILEAGRGLGLCPQLVQTVIEREKADRFWAVVQPDHALELEQAGFRVAAHFFRREGAAAMECGPYPERGRALASLVGLEFAGPGRVTAAA